MCRKSDNSDPAPEMVLPVSGHAAFNKAAHYFGVQAGNAPVIDDWVADLEECVAQVQGRRTEDRPVDYGALE